MSRRFPFPMPDGWFQVAYSDELAAGEVRSLEYFGRPLVLFRGEDGAVRLLDAYCPHLGAHLGVGGRVVGSAIRCPFHAWEWDGDGRCVRIPYARRIPPRARIGAWPVVERAGLVLTWFDKQGRPPAFDPPEVPEYGSDQWTGYTRRDWIIHSHPQEMAENTVDPAHFKYVHGTAELPTARAWQEGWVLRVAMDYPILAGERRLEGSIDIRCHGLGLGLTRFRGIVDTTLVVGGTPIDEERLHHRLSFLVRRQASPEATEGLGRAFVSEISRQFAEDMPVWENKVYWDKPLLCDGDGPIGAVREYAARFY